MGLIAAAIARRDPDFRETEIGRLDPPGQRLRGPRLRPAFPHTDQQQIFVWIGLFVGVTHWVLTAERLIELVVAELLVIDRCRGGT